MGWVPLLVAVTISMCLSIAVGVASDRLARNLTAAAVWHDGEQADTVFARGSEISRPDDWRTNAFEGELHCHGRATHFVGAQKDVNPALLRFCAK